MTLCQLTVDPRKVCVQITMFKWVVSKFLFDDHLKRISNWGHLDLSHKRFTIRQVNTLYWHCGSNVKVNMPELLHEYKAYILLFPNKKTVTYHVCIEL